MKTTREWEALLIESLGILPNEPPALIYTLVAAIQKDAAQAQLEEDVRTWYEARDYQPKFTIIDYEGVNYRTLGEFCDDLEERLGIKCPICNTALLPGQKCVCGYRDPRRGLTWEEIRKAQ